MTQVIALQSLQGSDGEAQAADELAKISELSFVVCGPNASDLSAWLCA